MRKDLIQMNLIKMALLHRSIENRRKNVTTSSKALPVKEKVENCDWHTNKFFNFISHNFDRLSKFFSKITL